MIEGVRAASVNMQICDVMNVTVGAGSAGFGPGFGRVLAGYRRVSGRELWHFAIFVERFVKIQT